MLQAAHFEQAADTLRKMSEIPGLRGAVFFDSDNGLSVLKGFPDLNESPELELGAVWVPVPEVPTSLAECRLKVETAVEDARRVLEEHVEGMVSTEWESHGVGFDREAFEEAYQRQIASLTIEA